MRTEKENKIKEIIKNYLLSAYGNEYEILIASDTKTRKYQSYCAMKHDTELIESYLQKIDNTNFDNTINSALTYSIISLYGKCFTDASSSKSPKLKSTIYSKEEDINTHKFLMDLRHHFISHRGLTSSEIETTFGLYKKETKTVKIEYARIKKMKFEREEITNIANLITSLKEIIHTKIKKQELRLNKSLIKQLSINE